MFERRLRALVLVLFLFGGAMLARAVQVQLVQGSYWRGLAAESMRRSELRNTTRGRILDVKGRVLAVDAPCVDLCVEFPALLDPPDEKWVRTRALARLRTRDEYRTADAPGRKLLIADEQLAVVRQIDRMWDRLAVLGHTSRPQIDATRKEIAQRVAYRQKSIVLARYRRAVSEHETRPAEPWYKSWLVENSGQPPQLDDIKVDLADQIESHVVLHDIDNTTRVELDRDLSAYPGLSLRPGVRRHYPYGEVAAHTIGRISKVDAEDLRRDADNDELRQYFPSDEIGREGLEAIGESQLRGSRGKVDRDANSSEPIATTPPAAGHDVRTTIDIELQAAVEQAFKHIRLAYGDHQVDDLEMPGAAVVIDIASGEVRALVSVPTYDLNDFDRIFQLSRRDDFSRTFMNRATQFDLEPGSTVKPLVGLSASAAGLIIPTDTIRCDGYLIIDGRPILDTGRCWTMKIFHQTHREGSAPHPTGDLTLADAIERSCNVFFETLGHRLGGEALGAGFRRFGLGQRTGIGLPEARGRLPGVTKRADRGSVWFSAIGQDRVAATPLQMANAIATIARRGVWMRPTIIPAGDPQPPIPDGDTRGRTVDLHLDPAALDAVFDGMTRVVNSPGGTGHLLPPPRILVAGKTGSAQAATLSVPVRDADGEPLDRDGRRITDRLKQMAARRFVEPGTKAKPNPSAPWYRGTGKLEDERTHAWFVGFFPADHPKIAFAVFVEYGGSGGSAAGSVASKLIEACIEQGYVPAPSARPIE